MPKKTFDQYKFISKTFLEGMSEKSRSNTAKALLSFGDMELRIMTMVLVAVTPPPELQQSYNEAKQVILNWPVSTDIDHFAVIEFIRQEGHRPRRMDSIPDEADEGSMQGE